MEGGGGGANSGQHARGGERKRRGVRMFVLNLVENTDTRGWRVDVPAEAGRKMQHDTNFRKEKPFSEPGAEGEGTCM